MIYFPIILEAYFIETQNIIKIIKIFIYILIRLTFDKLSKFVIERKSELNNNIQSLRLVDDPLKNSRG